MTKVHLDAPARQYHQGSAQTHSFLKLLDAVADRGANRSIERLRVNQTHDASIGSWGDREKLQHLEFQLEEVAQLPTVEPAAELPRRRRGIRLKCWRTNRFCVAIIKSPCGHKWLPSLVTKAP